MVLYTIKTTNGREETVVDMMSLNVKNNGLDVKSIMHPSELKGYVFAEGNLADIHKATQGLLHIKALKEHPIKLSDIEKFMEVKRVAVDIGDEVEIVGGAFKGDKGIITRLDRTKDEVTIELREGAIPIPMTISTEFVRIVRKGAVKPEEIKADQKKPKKFSMDDLKKSFGGPEPVSENKA